MCTLCKQFTKVIPLRNFHTTTLTSISTKIITSFNDICVATIIATFKWLIFVRRLLIVLDITDEIYRIYTSREKKYLFQVDRKHTKIQTSSVVFGRKCSKKCQFEIRDEERIVLSHSRFLSLPHPWRRNMYFIFPPIRRNLKIYREKTVT